MFVAGQLLGSVSGALGLRSWLESNGHTLVVSSDKDGDGCEVERELQDADVVISQPFFPFYLTRERINSAPNLKMAITAGIGSDHVDLQAAIDNKIDVTEVTFCNSISVAEHVVMQILALVRNYIPSYKQVVNGGWNIADCVERAYDVERMHVGASRLRGLCCVQCALCYLGVSRVFSVRTLKSCARVSVLVFAPVLSAER